MGLTGLWWSFRYLLSAPHSPQPPLLTGGGTGRRAVRYANSSGRVQGSWPWLLGCWFWSIKCTEGPAQVSCDPQATPGGSCNRHSTRSVRGVADIDGPWVPRCRKAYEFGMRRRPRDARAGGAALVARAVRICSPGAPRRPPGRARALRRPIPVYRTEVSTLRCIVLIFGMGAALKCTFMTGLVLSLRR